MKNEYILTLKELVNAFSVKGVRSMGISRWRIWTRHIDHWLHVNFHGHVPVDTSQFISGPLDVQAGPPRCTQCDALVGKCHHE